MAYAQVIRRRAGEFMASLGSASQLPPDGPSFLVGAFAGKRTSRCLRYVSVAALRDNASLQFAGSSHHTVAPAVISLPDRRMGIIAVGGSAGSWARHVDSPRDRLRHCGTHFRGALG